MPKRYKQYRTPEALANAKQCQQKSNNKYYSSVVGSNTRQPYTQVEVAMILSKALPDKQIAGKCGRTVLAIQVARTKWKSNERNIKNGAN